MNEQAVEHAYSLFKADGYENSIDDFQSLLQTNNDAVSHAFNLFRNDGYQNSIEEFETLLGLKKKDQTDQEDDSSVLESGTSDVDDGSLVLGESEESEETEDGPNQIFDELKDNDGGSLATNLSPDDTSHMVDLSQSFPEIKKLPSEKENYNSRLIDPKAAQFLTELKEIYPEKDFNELQITSGYRDQKHHHFYESERKGEKPTSNVHSRHKHGLALDFGYDSGKKLMEFLLNDPNGQVLAKKWGEGGNLGNGINDEFIDMYAKKHDRNHLHFSFKRGQIVNEDYTPPQEISINLNEPIDENVIIEEEIEEEVTETTPEEIGSMDNPGLYGGFNSQSVEETPELFDEYSIDAELEKYLTGEGGLEDKMDAIKSMRNKSVNANNQPRLVSKYKVKPIVDVNGNVIAPERNVYISYDVNENGVKTYKIVDPFLGDFVSSNENQNNAIKELEKEIQEKEDEYSRRDPDWRTGAASKRKMLLARDIKSLKEQLNQTKKSTLGKTSEKDAIVEWMYANYVNLSSADEESLNNSLSSSKDFLNNFLNAQNSLFDKKGAYSWRQYDIDDEKKQNPVTWNRQVDFFDNPFWDDFMPTESDAYRKGINLGEDFTIEPTGENLMNTKMPWSDSDGYEPGEGLESYISNGNDIKNLQVGQYEKDTGVGTATGEKEITLEGVEGLLSTQVDEMIKLKDDKNLWFLWNLYNQFYGFDENFTKDDYKKLMHLDRKISVENIDGDLPYDTYALREWVQLQRNRQIGFSNFVQEHHKTAIENSVKKLKTTDVFKEYEEKANQILQNSDDMVIIAQKLKKPHGYKYLDKEEYESDLELVKEYNSLLEENKNLKKDEEKLKEESPEFASYIALDNITTSIEDYATLAWDLPPIIKEHHRWLNEKKIQASNRRRDRKTKS